MGRLQRAEPPVAEKKAGLMPDNGRAIELQ
jgi:hypothetical protein